MKKAGACIQYIWVKRTIAYRCRAVREDDGCQARTGIEGICGHSEWTPLVGLLMCAGEQGQCGALSLKHVSSQFPIDVSPSGSSMDLNPQFCSPLSGISVTLLGRTGCSSAHASLRTLACTMDANVATRMDAVRAGMGFRFLCNGRTCRGWMELAAAGFVPLTPIQLKSPPTAGTARPATAAPTKLHRVLVWVRSPYAEGDLMKFQAMH